ncbi:MAG: hypothetical protein RR825_02210, partial [Ruthenibacterium sp.]
RFSMKRVFGMVEAVFDVLYLIAASAIGVFLLMRAQGGGVRLLAGGMALVLACGDAFHLVPRICAVVTRQEEALRAALGRGKQITSVTMTIFYLMLWHIGLLLFAPADMAGDTLLLYLLAAVRIALCLLPQNKWQDRYPPVRWGIWRNLPFFAMGIAVALLFGVYGSHAPGMGLMWLAIVLSFAFYLPVVLWANRNAKIGMLMLPKTCAYVWMLVMCLSL